MFIPTPLSLLKGSGLAGIIMFPLVIAFYVSVVGILGVSSWGLISFIFKEELHNEDNIREDIESKKSKLFFRSFKIAGFIVGASFASAIAIIAIFAYAIKATTHTSELKRYLMHYEAEDYNDSRIKYYVRELDENSQKLINSDNTYDDVVANMKREISLECIKVFRKEHNATKKYQADMQIENFRLNARNRSATTDEMREISIKKEKFLTYNHTGSSYGLSNPSLKLQESCQKLIPASTMFKKVMPAYIQYQEKELEKARTYALTYSTRSKYLISLEEWVKILHERYAKQGLFRGQFP